MKLKDINKLGLAALLLGSVSAANAMTLDDIQYWAGSGTNRAGLVIDWNDNKSSPALVWGYRWNGTASGMDMLLAVAKADPRLYGHFGNLSWGMTTFGLGYDVSGNGAFATLPALTFDSDGILLESNTDNVNDARTALDTNNHFAEGWNAGYWAYYLKASSSQDWTSAMTGSTGRKLTDGAWDGYSFAPGFLATEPVEPTPAMASQFAFEVASSKGPFGSAPYDDPASLLGMPSTNFYDPWGGWSGGTKERRVKLVEPAYNLDGKQAHKLITTLNEGSSIVVRFEQPIKDDPNHPYGVDFLVFGNSFYTSSGFVNDSANLNTLKISGGAFYEPMKVSVSPGYTGKAGQDAADPQTWDWYCYNNGPFADAAFPTHAYHWNRSTATWSDALMDFTKPVNPTMGNLLTLNGPKSLTAADAVDLYDGSGGGAGFDLAESGFTSVQYIKVEGLPDYSGGEVDAIASVRPMVLGDSLTITPYNLTNNTETLHFQKPGCLSQNGLSLSFSNVSDVACVNSYLITNATTLAPFGFVLDGAGFSVAPVLGTDAISFKANLKLNSGMDYRGDGKDLILLHQVETDWEGVEFTYDATTHSVNVGEVTDSAAYALIRVTPPQLMLSLTVDGFGYPLTKVQFHALPGYTYTLEKSTDLVHWDEVASQSPLVAGKTALSYSADAKSAFFRLRLTRL